MSDPLTLLTWNVAGRLSRLDEQVDRVLAHGRRDPIMDIEFARRARALLEAGGLDVTYYESDAAHHIDPA